MRSRRIGPAGAVAWMVAGILALAACPALADLYNGDFQADPPLDGWDNSGYNPPGNYVEGVVDPELLSTVAHLHAETTYAYEGGEWTGQLQQAYVQQFTTLQAGQTHLRFDGKALKDGLEVLDPTVTVIAAGGGGGGRSVTWDQWSGCVFPLVGPLGEPLPPGTMIGVVVQVSANPPAGGGEEGQQTTQVVDLCVDNIHLVPLPQTLLLLAVSAAGLLRRRRR